MNVFYRFHSGATDKPTLGSSQKYSCNSRVKRAEHKDEHRHTLYRRSDKKQLKGVGYDHSPNKQSKPGEQ